MPTPIEAIAGVANAAQPLPWMVTGGQPTEAHLHALAAAGVKLVLDIRDPTEPRPFDEPAAIAKLGMRYVNIPVTQANLDDDTLGRILAEIRGNGEQPMLFHCASGNRVGGAMIAFLMRDKGMSEGEAVQMGMRIGLRSAEILQWGTEYGGRR